LTSNGKINRNILPQPGNDIETGAEYEKPRNEMEEKLERIWAKILNLKKVGINDNFFEIGGQSLDLIRLFGEIYRVFNIEIPITSMYKHPKIKEFSKMLTNTTFDQETFVLLGNKAAKVKIFSFPPLQGFGVQYKTLSTYLEDYSLCAFNFLENLENKERLDKYVGIITDIQPTGPYILLGWSAAGGLTFEVAKKLEKQGFRVSDIILVDCFHHAEKKKSINDLKIDKNMEKGIEKTLEFLNIEFLKEKIKKRIKKYMIYNHNLLNLEVVNSNVHLITSEDLKKKDGTSGFEEFTNQSFVTYRGYGPHNDMLVVAEFVEKNVGIIKQILDNSTKQI
jgi:acyl carrier protein